MRSSILATGLVIKSICFLGLMNPGYFQNSWIVEDERHSFILPVMSFVCLIQAASSSPQVGLSYSTFFPSTPATIRAYFEEKCL